MKKIFIKEIFLSLVFILSSFFLLFPNVRAEEITINITDDMFSYLTPLQTIINNANITCLDTSNTISCDYFIRYQNDFSYSNMYLLLNKGSSYPKVYLESGKLRANNSNQKYIINSDYSISTSWSNYNSSDWQIFQFDSPNSIRLLLYSSFDIPFRSIDNNTYTFSYNGENYSIVNDGTNFAPTLYDLYQHFNSSPPIPSDDTPLLTQFFTISIEKLQTICDFIVSSYIYLAVIVIFLIYCSIYLLRRLK